MMRPISFRNLAFLALVIAMDIESSESGDLLTFCKEHSSRSLGACRESVYGKEISIICKNFHCVHPDSIADDDNIHNPINAGYAPTGTPCSTDNTDMVCWNGECVDSQEKQLPRIERHPDSEYECHGPFPIKYV